jgi:hypothetical protein
MPESDVLLDHDGYPTEAAFKLIREWKGEHKALLEFVRGLWRYPEYFGPPMPYVWPRDWKEPIEEGSEYLASTVGWSGNESLIDAMQENTFFWMKCWFATQRGGHYTFHVNEKDLIKKGGR